MYFLSIFLHLAAISNLILAVNVQCSYLNGEWGTLGTIYYCSVTSSLDVYSQRYAFVNSTSGSHLTSEYGDKSVLGFSVLDKNLHYFPRELEKIFVNLNGIEIRNCHLKEIHQWELRSFPNLAGLWLGSNDIEVIEERLFAYNPNLKVVSLFKNKIKSIHHNVFDHLTKLAVLDLLSNNCIDAYASTNAEAKGIVQQVKGKCPNSQPPVIECVDSCFECQTQMWKVVPAMETLRATNSEKLKKIDAAIETSKLSDAILLRKIEKVEQKCENKHQSIEQMYKNINTSLVEKAKKVENYEEHLNFSNEKLNAEIDNIKGQFEDFQNKIENIYRKHNESDQIISEELKKVTETVNSFNADLTNKIKYIEATYNPSPDQISFKTKKLGENFKNLQNELQNFDRIFKISEKSSASNIQLLNITIQSKFQKIDENFVSVDSNLKSLEITLKQHQNNFENLKFFLNKDNTGDIKLSQSEISSKLQIFDKNFEILQNKIKRLESNFEEYRKLSEGPQDDGRSIHSYKIHESDENLKNFSIPYLVQIKVDESFKSIQYKIMKKVENTVSDFTEKFKTVQDEILEEKTKAIGEIIAENSEKVESIEWSLSEMQTKILKMVEGKIARMEKSILAKMDKNIKSLEELIKKNLKESHH